MIPTVELVPARVRIPYRESVSIILRDMRSERPEDRRPARISTDSKLVLSCFGDLSKNVDY